MEKIGDFVIYEAIACELKFKLARALWADEHCALVQSDGRWWERDVVRIDMIQAHGSEQDMRSLFKQVSKLASARDKAVEAAEDRRIEIGGQHAGRIRQLFKRR